MHLFLVVHVAASPCASLGPVNAVAAWGMGSSRSGGGRDSDTEEGDGSNEVDD